MSDVEQGRVREQLNRLLDSQQFKNSKRYPLLLRFIVEETLAGRGEYLKERLLGVQVFDRPPDYDTATDPIVRVTIAEIRKRIAQYYHDEEHDSEIRIELVAGRYEPEFRRRHGSEDVAIAHIGLADPEPVETVPVVPKAQPGRRSLRVLYRWIAAAVLVAAFAAWIVVRWTQQSALSQLWAPILASPHAVLFCLPIANQRSGEPAVPPAVSATDAASSRTFLDFESLGENVVYSDMLATLRIAGVLAVAHRDYRVRLNVGTTLDDLREGPTVLVGGLDNQWTLRALQQLRYGFAGSDAEGFWISDSMDRGKKDWYLDLKRQYVTVTRDYALVARVHNEQTGQPAMIVAGIGMSGTAAAGQFVADERSAEDLRKKIGPRFADRDFEVVLSTDVVDGIAGSPKVLSVSVR